METSANDSNALYYSKYFEQFNYSQQYNTFPFLAIVNVLIAIRNLNVYGNLVLVWIIQNCKA